jgi:hypothetical protein
LSQCLLVLSSHPWWCTKNHRGAISSLFLQTGGCFVGKNLHLGVQTSCVATECFNKACPHTDRLVLGSKVGDQVLQLRHRLIVTFCLGATLALWQCWPLLGHCMLTFPFWCRLVADPLICRLMTDPLMYMLLFSLLGWWLWTGLLLCRLSRLVKCPLG